jgi:poly [ADP-ribose] polymerase
MATLKKDNKIIVYPVDSNSRVQGSIFIENDVAYTCTLNQTDLETNKNKFYIMQLIQNSGKYTHFIRYGRTGEVGKISYNDYTTKESAIAAFTKQFKSKTGNTWNTEFKYKEGKYFMAKVEYEAKEEIKKPKTDVKSKLDDRVQTLIKLISDVETMNKSLVELNVDPKKMPLGKIGDDQIAQANTLLTEINGIVKNEDVTTDDVESKLTKLCSKFYTLIPYATAGRSKPPLINDKDLVSKFTELLEELKNLVVAVKIINGGNNDGTKHACDAIYDQLNTEIKPLDKNSKEWQYIIDYINNTQGPTHKFKIDVMDIYDIERKGEKEQFDKVRKEVGNVQLLWHGSRIVNFASIMQKGLLLNPESLGVYVSGKMFGQSIYLASCHTKSVGYCATEVSNGIGAMLLCEAALGKPLMKINADYYISDKTMKKEGTNSTWGQGKWTQSGGVKIGDTLIPNGKLTKANVNATLLYDEHMIYSQTQVHQKYLVLFKKHAL